MLDQPSIVDNSRLAGLAGFTTGRNPSTSIVDSKQRASLLDGICRKLSPSRLGQFPTIPADAGPNLARNGPHRAISAGAAPSWTPSGRQNAGEENGAQAGGGIRKRWAADPTAPRRAPMLWCVPRHGVTGLRVGRRFVSSTWHGTAQPAMRAERAMSLLIVGTPADQESCALRPRCVPPAITDKPWIPWYTREVITMLRAPAIPGAKVYGVRPVP